MPQRMVLKETSPGVYEAMLGLERYLAASALDNKLRELVKIHASQINGCAFCIDLHTKGARKLGESEQRIYALDAWREAPSRGPGLVMKSGTHGSSNLDGPLEIVSGNRGSP